MGIEGTLDNSLFVFPNPTIGLVNISSSANGVQQVSITNMLGEVILSKEINLVAGSSFTMDISDEPNGIYLLRVGNTTKKIVKQ